MHTHNKHTPKKDLLQSRREIREAEASLVFLSQAQPELCFLVPELSQVSAQLGEPEAKPFTLAV